MVAGQPAITAQPGVPAVVGQNFIQAQPAVQAVPGQSFIAAQAGVPAVAGQQAIAAQAAVIGQPSIAFQAAVMGQPFIGAQAAVVGQPYIGAVPAVPAVAGNAATYSMNCWTNTCPSSLNTYTGLGSATCPANTQVAEACVSTGNTRNFSGFSGEDNNIWF